jgi:hypothetical protein
MMIEKRRKQLEEEEKESENGENLELLPDVPTKERDGKRR